MDYDRKRKLLAGISISVVLLLMVLLTLFVCHWLNSFSQEDFREHVRSFGVLAPLVMLALQILQVFVAVVKHGIRLLWGLFYRNCPGM